jgi:hypothetical protein
MSAFGGKADIARRWLLERRRDHSGLMLANLITFETALKIPGAAATAPSVARMGRDNDKGGKGIRRPMLAYDVLESSPSKSN